jgi:carboxypeptidase PM20D1
MAQSSSPGRFVAFFALALVFLIVLLGTRALMLESKQLVVQAAGPLAIDAQLAAGHLAGAIRFRTVSDEEASSQAEAASLAELDALRGYLEQTYPQTHARLVREIVAAHSLLYTWQGRDAGLEPMLLAAHMDVVPAEDGAGSAWTHPPFDGVVSDGYVWGRGAIDDKFGVISILEAVEHLVGEGFEPQRTVYLALGHDEEVGGTGAEAIAALLKSRGVKLDFVLDEGLPITVGIVPGIGPDVALVGIAEKGYATVRLTVETAGGHSSTPPRQTAIGILSAAVSNVESHAFPAQLSGVARDMFQWLAPEGAFAQRIVFANDWLLAPVIVRILSGSPDTDALIRTTTAVTVIDGGVKENVLPLTARALVNFRTLPGDDPEEILEHVREAVADERVKAELAGAAWASDPPSPLASEQFERVNRVMREVYAATLVAPGLMVGSTDARWYGDLTEHIYRTTLVPVTSEDVRRIHGIDERSAVEQLVRSINFYARLIRASAQHAGPE